MTNTENYGLSQFTGEDCPDWLQHYNEDMKRIDQGSIPKVEGCSEGELPELTEEGKLRQSGATLADITNGDRAIVSCDCAYNTTTKIFALTKKYPDQITGNNFTVRFTPDHDYVPGATLTLDGETYTTAYADSDAPVIAGAFRQNAVVTLNFQKLPGGGVT